MSVDEKLDSLNLEFLTHAAVAVKNVIIAKQLGRRLLQNCKNKNTRLVEYFCCLRCGLPRTRGGSKEKCQGCPCTQ